MWTTSQRQRIDEIIHQADERAESTRVKALSQGLARLASSAPFDRYSEISSPSIVEMIGQVRKLRV